jgi:hypothetical protein
MMKPVQIAKSFFDTVVPRDASLLGVLMLRLNASDDFGRTCQGLSMGRPTCLATWTVVNLIALLAPRTSLTNEDVTALGVFMLLMFASAAQARLDLRSGRTTSRIKAVEVGHSRA